NRNVENRNVENRNVENRNVENRNVENSAAENSEEEKRAHRRYIDFAQSAMEQFDLSAVEKHWSSALSNIQKLESNHLATGPNRYTSRTKVLEGGQMGKIHAYCKTHMLSPALYIRGIYALLIRYYFGVSGDFIIRELFGGRERETQKLMGCFFHTIPMVFPPELFRGKLPAARYFREVFSLLMGMGTHRDISIHLQNRLMGEEDLVFYFNYRTFLKLDINGKNYYVKKLTDYSGSDFPEKEVQLITKDTPEGFALELNYNKKLFDGDLFLDRFLLLSRQISEGVENLEDLDYITASERKTLLSLAAGETREFPSQTPLFRLFEKQAADYPGRIAVKCDGEEMAYHRLNEKANRLAHYLSANFTLATDSLVGVMLERSPQMMECILAIWKTGAAYIPIDVKYPPSRVKDILADSNARVLLTLSEYVTPHWDGVAAERIVKLDQKEGEIAGCPGENPVAEIDMTGLAYVIYTSGSTGKPKGVMVEHIGMMNHIQAKIDDFQLASDSIVAQNASHTFDISVWQFFVALALGGAAVIYPEESVLEPDEFIRRVIEDRVTILEVVPSYLSVMLDSMEQTPVEFPGLKYLAVTGETVKPKLLQRWFALYPYIPVINAYGPTEASDDITHHIMKNAPEGGRVSIGKPVQNLNVYVLGENDRPCPFGIKGEICVSGVGVGRGYLNDVLKTAEAFKNDPFAVNERGRLYRTGDLGYYNPDGTIEFLGRKDFQVKIRGFRIELGEIENCISTFEGVKNAVVIAANHQETAATPNRDGGFLCAYLEMEDQLDIPKMQEFLGKKLPHYMIPAYFIQLPQIPLTINGKVDRKALPKPGTDIRKFTGYSPPTNDIEKKLVKIWSEVLEVEEDIIGIDGNFFNLGGHSLKATTLIAKIHKAFDVRIPMVELFNTPTVKNLARFVQKETGEDFFSSIEPSAENEYYALSSAQKRLYLAQQMETESVAFNLPIVLLLEGDVEKEKLTGVFSQLLQRHESLRTSFHMVEGEPMQKVHTRVDFQLNYDELSIQHREQKNAAIESAAGNFISPFDLSRAPLLRAALLKIADLPQEHLLMIELHHIFVDSVSMRILVEEFIALYNGNQLPPLTLHYKDYSQWQQNWSPTGTLKKQVEYWLKLYAGHIPVLQLATDYPRPEILQTKGRQVEFEIDEQWTLRLRQRLADTGTTMNMFLLAVLNILLARYSMQEDIVVGAPVIGRRHADLEHIIGIFLNMLAIRNYPENQKTFDQFLGEVKENTLTAYDNQDCQFDELVAKLGIKRDPGRSPLFDVAFSFEEHRNKGDSDENPGLMGKNKSLKVTPYRFQHHVAKYELQLRAAEGPDSLQLILEYQVALFKKETVESLKDHFMDILKQVVNDGTLRLMDIEISHQLLAATSDVFEDDDDEFDF
ncbi:MAG: amino acid adenylation domain-containing protein, partial [bacterium]|nr:amino acid adenylation domain-containing protein [bacterium]